MAEKEKKEATNEEELSLYDKPTSTQKCAILMIMKKKLLKFSKLGSC